jgi:L-ascorbate metabolism protein UlaG (beta-lactamase superfamily)
MEKQDIIIDKWKSTVKDYYENSYVQIWDGILSGLQTVNQDTLWLMGAANYIFSTGNIKWAMDFRFPSPTIREKINDRLKDDAEKLSFIILTHEHEDHYDIETIRSISNTGIHWIIPDFFDRQPLYEAGLYDRNITWINPGDCVEIGGIHIQAFKSLHYMSSKRPGVPEMGYLIETGSKRLLFPCDVREYAPEKSPHFKGVDVLFAHVWLGADNALNFPCDKYLSDYCKFMTATGAKKILLTHLYEVGRTVDNMWTYSHAGLLMDNLLSLNPELEIAIPQVGIPYTL